MNETNPRRLALKLLARIRRERSWANLVLAHAPEMESLAARDKALVTKLVYGTLQMEGSLDAAVRHVAASGKVKAPPTVVDALRLGAYQLVFGGIATHAAVAETVAAVTTRPIETWRRFVRGTLSSLAREKDDFPWVDPAEDPVAWLSLSYGHPTWLVERLLHEYGAKEAEDLLEANNTPAPVHLRVNTLATTREDVFDMLKDQGYQVARGTFAREALIVGGPPGVWREPGAGRLFIVQDEGSMMAPHLLEPQPGERVLDIAAGRGGKATHMAALMGDVGEVIALDVYEAKTSQCRELAAALGASIVQCRHADARSGVPSPTTPKGGAGATGSDRTIEEFDAVLLDAPCSGTGTLRRRAELRWRREPDDLALLVALQVDLMRAAARLTRKGGRLVYATCSLLAEENEKQVERFLSSPAGAGWRVIEQRQLLPSRDGTDGHYAALLIREP